MLIIYETHISRITFVSQDAVCFEAFSLGLSDLGAIIDFKTLFVSVLQVIAMLRSNLAIFFRRTYII